MATDRIALVAEDMFFVAKINAAASAAGRTIERIRSREQLEALSGLPPALVLVDLKANAVDPFQAITFLKSEKALAGVPVIAFVAHVQTEMIRRAREAGCDMVLPHSALTNMLPDLVTGEFRADGGPQALEETGH